MAGLPVVFRQALKNRGSDTTASIIGAAFFIIYLSIFVIFKIASVGRNDIVISHGYPPLLFED
jgi:hypothetical protein